VTADCHSMTERRNGPAGQPLTSASLNTPWISATEFACALTGMRSRRSPLLAGTSPLMTSDLQPQVRRCRMSYDAVSSTDTTRFGRKDISNIFARQVANPAPGPSCYHAYVGLCP